MKKKRILYQLLVSLVLGIIFFYYAITKNDSEAKDRQLTICNAEISNEIRELKVQNGVVILNFAIIGDVYHFPLSYNFGAENECQNFMVKVKPGDKFIKKTKADTFITVRATDTLTWHIDCPY